MVARGGIEPPTRGFQFLNQSQTKLCSPFGRHLSGQPRARHSCSSPTAAMNRRNPSVWRSGRARSHQMTLSITSVPRLWLSTARSARSASPSKMLATNTKSLGGRSSIAASAAGTSARIVQRFDQELGRSRVDTRCFEIPVPALDCAAPVALCEMNRSAIEIR